MATGLSAVLSNPLVQLTLATQAAGGLAQAYNQTQQGRDQALIDESLAQGSPVESAPRSGLIGSFSRLLGGHPMEAVDPATLAREKLAVENQQLERIKTFADITDKNPNIAKDPTFSKLIADSHLGLSSEAFSGGGKKEMVDIYGPQGASERVPVTVGQPYTPPEGWSLSKPTIGQETPFKDWRKKYPDAPIEDYFKLTRQATDTETPLPAADVVLGPDGKTPGVYLRSKSGGMSFQAMPGATLGAPAQKAQEPVDNLKDALSTLDDLDNSLDVLPRKSEFGSGVQAKSSMFYGRYISSDPQVADFDSARSRILEIATLLRKGNRLNQVEYRAIADGLPGDHDSQQSARIKIDKERDFLQKILDRETSRGALSPTSVVGPTGADIVKGALAE